MEVYIKRHLVLSYLYRKLQSYQAVSGSLYQVKLPFKPANIDVHSHSALDIIHNELTIIDASKPVSIDKLPAFIGLTVRKMYPHDILHVFTEEEGSLSVGWSGRM